MIIARGIRLLWNCTFINAVKQPCFFSHARLHNSRRIYSSMLLAAPIVVHCETNNTNRLKTPDPCTLTHPHLIRNACQSSVDSASSLFHQTVAALLEAEQEYAQAIYTLISLLEYHLESLKLSTEQQDKIWDMIISQKQIVREKKENKQDLELLYQTVETVLNSLAQAAFIAGSDKAGIQSGEQVVSVQTHLKMTRETSLTADNGLNEMNVKVINATSERQRKENKIEDTGDVLIESNQGDLPTVD